MAQATSRVPLRMGSRNSILPSRNLGEGTSGGISRGSSPRVAMTRASERAARRWRTGVYSVCVQLGIAWESSEGYSQEAQGRS